MLRYLPCDIGSVLEQPITGRLTDGVNEDRCITS